MTKTTSLAPYSLEVFNFAPYHIPSQGKYPTNSKQLDK